LNQAVSRAVAQVRKQLAAQRPQLGRGVAPRGPSANWPRYANGSSGKSPTCSSTAICLCNVTSATANAPSYSGLPARLSHKNWLAIEIAPGGPAARRPPSGAMSRRRRPTASRRLFRRGFNRWSGQNGFYEKALGLPAGRLNSVRCATSPMRSIVSLTAAVAPT